MAMNKWRYALVIVIVWFGVVAYIGFGVSDFFTAEVNKNNLRRASNMLAKSQFLVKKLTDDITKLRERVAALEQGCGRAKASETAQRHSTRATDGKGIDQIAPSYEIERTRKRASKELREMWYFLSAEITKINKKTRDDKTRASLNRMLDNFAEIHRALSNNLETLNNINELVKWRKQEHESLTKLVQNRLGRLQNPEECDSARKLICKLNKGCGYGCQVHHLLYCFLTAYGSNRTLILDSENWRYSPAKGWQGVFMPVSKTCTTAQGAVEEWSPSTQNHQNVLLPIVDNVSPKPQHLPLAVPADLADRIKLIHGFPFAWWIGQFTKYLFRYQPDVEDEINDKKQKLGFQHPIVGVHIRRTDKINLEAAYHGLEEYMYWVDLYFKRLLQKQKVHQKRVYLASDDPTVLEEAKKSYPEYEFVSDNDISKSADLRERYTDKSLHGVIFDIDMLSRCDYVVCTFSSQVCRVAYEMMQAHFPDTSDNFQSLDDVYYFGGQSVNDVQALYPYKSSEVNELSFDVGARIQIAGNHWDGYSKGTFRDNRRAGLFPSYLVEKYIHVVKFPDYSNFDVGIK